MLGNIKFFKYKKEKNYCNSCTKNDPQRLCKGTGILRY